MVKTSDEFVNLSGSSDAAPNPESTNPDFLSHKICFDMLKIYKKMPIKLLRLEIDTFIFMEKSKIGVTFNSWDALHM